MYSASKVTPTQWGLKLSGNFSHWFLDTGGDKWCDSITKKLMDNKHFNLNITIEYYAKNLASGRTNIFLGRNLTLIINEHF